MVTEIVNINKQSPVQRWLQFLIVLACLVNLSGLCITLMEPDAAVYAAISKNMLARNNYAELYFQGADWLDKPHFQFWVTAVFFKVFGVHTWSYKLPGILFVFLGAWYTYRFAILYYNKTVGLWAALILLTAEHIILSNNDVRAEPYLTGLIIASVYHFCRSIHKDLSWHVVLASLFAACAVMTKGPYTLIPIAGAVAGGLAIKKEWRALFHWKWMIAVVLVTLFIMPEIYSLWLQFDSHPEKTVFGKTNVSGIRFFLWDSQFGRFSNTGPITGKGDPAFFLHTLIWAFLPWSFLMYVALIEKIRLGFRRNRSSEQLFKKEWFGFSGAMLALLVFSISSFQLPHYTNIIFPFLAVLTAQYISTIIEERSRAWVYIQTILSILLVLAASYLIYTFKPDRLPIIALVIILSVLIIMLLFHARYKLNPFSLALARTALAVIFLNLCLNWLFYPGLLKYQSGTEAAYYMNKNYPGQPGIVSQTYTPGFEYYLKSRWSKIDTPFHSPKPDGINGLWYLRKSELEYLDRNEVKYEIMKQFPHYHITKLKWKFIDHKTRSQELDTTFLIRFQ